FPVVEIVYLRKYRRRRGGNRGRALDAEFGGLQAHDENKHDNHCHQSDGDFLEHGQYSASGSWVGRRVTAQRKEVAETRLTQVKSAPDQDTEQNRREEWIADAYMGRGGAAKIAGQQDRAKNGGPRHHVEDRTDEFEH